jgi:predicted DNA-binding transcriptional regulator YafY
MSPAIAPTRHARLLQIFQHLQTGNGFNATELATQLDVCRRTIFRDLSILKQAGVELFYDDCLDSYRLDPRTHLCVAPALSQQELTTLIAAVELSALRQMPDCHQVLRQSVNKLLASAPRQLQHQVTRVVKACSTGTEDRPADPHPGHVVYQVLAAISQRKILRIRMFDPHNETVIETRFAPYQLIARADSWQIVGRSSRHRGVRAVEPSLVQRAELTDEIYAIPRRYQACS